MSSYVSPKFVTRQVNGRDINFYAISVDRVIRLKTLAKPLIEGISMLFSLGDPKFGELERDIIEDGKLVCSEKHKNGETSELLQKRAMLYSESWGKVIDSLTDEKNAILLCDLAMCSMREEFERGYTSKQVEEFYRQIDLPVFIEILKGTAAANFEAFAPLAGKLREAAGQALERVGDLSKVAPTPLKPLS